MKIFNYLKINIWKIFKVIWLMFLLYICGIYIIMNYDRIITGMKELDFIVVLLSVVIALMPFISEIDLWGLKVKREIQKVEKELNREIIHLQKQIINVETNNSQNINFGYLPTKEELMANNKNNNSISLSVEKENSKLLFFLQTRITLEKEMTRIISPLGRTRMALGGGIQLIKQYGLLQDKELRTLNTINDICNRSIHGEIISDDYYDFVKDNISDIISKLKTIELPVTCI